MDILAKTTKMAPNSQTPVNSFEQSQAQSLNGHAKAIEATYGVNPSTGRVVKFEREDKWDHWVAILTILYLLLTLALFLWQLFSVAVWNQITWFGGVNVPIVDNPILQVAITTFIGGALGGIANAIRSFNFWHSEHYAFSRFFFWKYITKPWLGGTLALFVVAIVYSGVGVLGGATVDATIDNRALFSVFTIGALAGFGAQDLYRWLDAQVTSLFKITEVSKILTPALIGKTEEEATKILKDARLNLGQKSMSSPSGDEKLGMVVKNQTPPPNTPINIGETVDINIGEPT